MQPLAAEPALEPALLALEPHAPARVLARARVGPVQPALLAPELEPHAHARAPSACAGRRPIP